MPAVQVDDIRGLPRITSIDTNVAINRRVLTVTDAPRMLEGAGFEVRRAFSGIDLRLADPFLLLDHLGAVEYAPGQAKGAPDHPHRGFETVTYMMDGELEHRDSNGGGGLITDGATQWMTAGAGIVHSEMPTEQLVAKGGLFHGVQIWVNLPMAEKWTPPQYQDLDANKVVLLASDDGGAIVRLIAGDIADHHGPGSTRTPVYVLAGQGSIGQDQVSIKEGQLTVMDRGDLITISCDPKQDSRSATLEILVLGGSPIGESISWYGPFVMNTRDEIRQAIEDYQAGRMGHIQAKQAD
jgi:redox-sensitive bicupin YhaK (pirin superfamily)